MSPSYDKHLTLTLTSRSPLALLFTVHTKHTSALLPLLCSSPPVPADATLSAATRLQPHNSYDDLPPSHLLCISKSLFYGLFHLLCSELRHIS